MAVNYNTLFHAIGKIIGRSAQYAPWAASTLPADLVAIAQQFGTGSTGTGEAQDPITGLSADYTSFQNQIATFRRKLAATYVKNTLTNYDLVVSQIAGLTSTDLTTVLKALVQDMVDQGQTVKANAVALGAATAGAGNTGNGTALADAVLDGYNVPVKGGFAHQLYAGLASQLAVPSETMQLVCVRDSFTGGTQEGAESWSWSGGTNYQPFDWHAEGSGAGGALTTAHVVTTIPNLGWETFSVADTPDSWTLVAGAAGVDFFQDTAAANIYRGASALKLAGTGATMPALAYAVPAGALSGRRRYLFTTRAKASGVVGAGNLQIVFTGTGYAAGGTEQILQSLGGIGAGYGLYQFWLNTPANIPSDFTLNIRVTGANLGAGSFVWLDSGSFSPVVYKGGVNCQVVSGNVPWVAGDRLSFTVQDTATGLAQDFFRKAFGVQLPSKNDGSNTIDDSWFT